MTGALSLAGLGVFAYLMGSVLWGDLVARRHGVNIWAVDTRNPGAGNVVRNVGVRQGIMAYVGDVMTAATVMLVAGTVYHTTTALSVAAAGLLLGTFFSAFQGFRGGIGLAKFMGISFGLNPVGFLVFAPLGIWTVAHYHNPAWGGGLVVGGTALVSLAWYHDLTAVALIVAVGLVVFVRSRMQA